MNYLEHSNDHDHFSQEHVQQFLRNHKTGTDNQGRRFLGGILTERARKDDDFDLAEYHPSVLDVACGSAVNFETWESMGIKCNYTGFDLTQKLLDEARRRYGDKINLVQGYAQEVDRFFQPQSFDYVVIRHFLEHVHEGKYEDSIKKCFEIAKNELVIVFFLLPHDGNEDKIELRPSNIEGHPEVKHYWNEYAWGKMLNFLSTFGVQIKTHFIQTPHAAHPDFIVRLMK